MLQLMCVVYKNIHMILQTKYNVLMEVTGFS